MSQEEKRIRKVRFCDAKWRTIWWLVQFQAVKTRLEKATAAAHVKHRVTFNSDIQVSAVPKPKVKLANRVQFETGETTKGGRKSELSKTRTSKRMHTVLNTTATVTRLKESEQKKVCLCMGFGRFLNTFSRRRNPRRPRQNPELTPKGN
jgi:hypothetical protein